jgi:hypothetical protein
MSSNSRSSLEKAKAALDGLKSITEEGSSSGKRLKEGVIFLLTSQSSGKRYVGCEYEGNIEKYLKELILRAESFKLQGSIFHDSYEVMKDDKVSFELLERLLVENKNSLCKRGMFYINTIPDIYNIWYLEDMLKSYDEKSWRVVEGKHGSIISKDNYKKAKMRDAKSKYDNVREVFNENIKLIKTRLQELYEQRILF